MLAEIDKVCEKHAMQNKKKNKKKKGYGMSSQIMQMCAIRWKTVGWTQVDIPLEATFEPHPVREVADISARLSVSSRSIPC